jgi:curved DNA-binding protein
MEFKDYYQILGVPRDATADDIKKAFRKLARKYHPDVSKEADAEARMKELNEANAVLSDPEKRAAYDQLGRGYQPGQEFRPPPDWDAGFEFSGRGFRPAKRPISRISSPSCSAHGFARRALAPASGALPGARRGSSRQGAARHRGRLHRRHPADLLRAPRSDAQGRRDAG